MKDIRYSIFNPTGNITALVETPVDKGDQAGVASKIMKVCPEVEQVGFVSFAPGRPVPALLRMAGGEFCGNAAMSTAALYLMRSGEEAETVRVNVSGTPEPVEVKLEKCENGSYNASVSMPVAKGISTVSLEGVEATAVEMEGITHIIIEEYSELYAMKEDIERAERAVKECCQNLRADCLGLMFLDMDEGMLTPLVYVPEADTMFWENSCASGTAACGIYLADKTGTEVDISLKEPGGIMRVSAGHTSGETILYGNTYYGNTYLVKNASL